MSERLFTAILSLPYFSDKAKENITKIRFESRHKGNSELVMYFNEVAREFEERLVPKKIERIDLPHEGLLISDKETIVKLIYSIAKHSTETNEALFSNHSYEQKDIDDALYTAFFERNKSCLETNFVHIIEKPIVFNRSYINFIWASLRYGTINIRPLATEETITGFLLPYVLVCGKYALLLNKECDRAHFICEPALSNAISENFSSLRKKCSPFTDVCVDEAEIMTKDTYDFFNVSSEKPIIVCSIPGSCVVEYGYEIWNEVVRKDIPKKTADFLIYSYLNYHHFQLKNIRKHYVLSDSLIEFAKTGNYAPISNKYINKFSPQLIKEAIKKWRISFKESNNFIIDSGKVFFPPFTQIDYYPLSARIHFDSVQQKFGVYDASVAINFNSISGAKKFFDALLSYQTNSDALMSEIQIDYTLESLSLISGS